MNNFPAFEAHGTRYTSPEQAAARIKEINEEIFAKGISDGRLTEWLLIEDALAAAWKTATDRKAAREAADWKRETIIRAEEDLRILTVSLDGKREESARYPIRRIIWIDKDGKRRSSQYTTESGYLRALIRMTKANADVVEAG